MLTLAITFIALACLTTLYDGALVTLGRYESEKILKNTQVKAYLRLLSFFRYKTSFEGFRFLLKSAKYTFRLLFGISSLLFLLQNRVDPELKLLPLLKAVVVILLVSYTVDFLSALIYFKKPRGVLKFLELPICLLLLPFVPFAAFGFLIMSAIHPEIFKPQALTPKQKQMAKARAEKAGRRYPNLVDNAWAANQ